MIQFIYALSFNHIFHDFQNFRLLFDGAVAMPSAYVPPTYADIDKTGTLCSA